MGGWILTASLLQIKRKNLGKALKRETILSVKAKILCSGGFGFIPVPVVKVPVNV